MKMLHRLTILLFVFLSLFSCSGNKKELKVSEKDIEGYWVSGYLLHNTELSREIASGNEKKPKLQLLRLKNVVNGFADTSYRIHGDTLLYRMGIKRVYKNDGIVEAEDFYPFRIVFYAKDRLILADDATHEEIIFYNLSILPDQTDTFTAIIIGENKIIINDSTTFQGAIGCSDAIHLLLNIKTDDAWKNNLDTIISRINWKAAVFVQESNNLKGGIIKRDSSGTTVEIPIPVIPHSLQVTTQKHSGKWSFMSSDVSDPALSMLIAELSAFETYCYFHDMLHIVNTR